MHSQPPIQQPPYSHRQPLNVIPTQARDNPLQWYRHRPPMLRIAIVCIIVVALIFLGVFGAFAIALATGHGAPPTPVSLP